MAFSDPAKNIQHLGIGEGMAVADFGSGAGHYTLEAAARVGDDGVVYAVDIQPELLRKVQNDARQYGFDNVEMCQGDLESERGSGLPGESVQVVLLSNILFQLADKKAPIVEAWRVLGKKGRLLIIDWSDSFDGVGPQPEYVVKKDDVTNIAQEAGFAFVESFDAGAHHYGLILRKQ